MSIFDTKNSSASAGASAQGIGTGAESGLNDERGIPSVNQRGYQSRGKLVMLAGGVIAMLIGLWVLNRGPATAPISPTDPKATKNDRFDELKGGDIAPPVAKAPPVIEVKPFEPPKPPTPLIDKPIGVIPKVDGQGAPLAQQGQRAAVQRPLTPLEKRMASPTIVGSSAAGLGSVNTRSAAAPVPGFAGLNADGSVSSGGTATNPNNPYTGTPITQTQPPQSLVGPVARGRETTPEEREKENEGSLAQVLKPTALSGSRAIKLADRRLMIAAGKLIDCSLDTAISTVVAGLVKCSLTRDIFGEDGTTVLLDRGTEMLGEYRSNLKTGQSRLGIVWNRAKTPKGVIIDVGSPAADPLGRAGVDGYLETHFWQKYGASILLSSLDDVLGIVVARARSNGTFFPQNTSQTGRSAAAVALENNIKIPPTIVKNQGEHVTIFVARDLDFRPVYGVQGNAMSSVKH
jgi:type IV secretion system protein VirB10